MITTLQHLANFSYLVNKTKIQFKNSYIVLKNSLEFNCQLTANPTKEEVAVTSGDKALKQCTAIGGSNTINFSGTFGGNNQTVSGIVIDNTSSNQGLFGYVGSNGTVKNIGIVNSYINVTGNCIGGVVGKKDKTVIHSYFLKTTNSNLKAVGSGSQATASGYFDAK